MAQQLALVQSNPCQNLSQLGKGAAPNAGQQQALAACAAPSWAPRRRRCI